MKQLLLCAWFLFIALAVFSQDYLITFGVDGHDDLPDSVRIYNQDQNSTAILSGDGVLHLVNYGLGFDEKHISQRPVEVFPNPFKSRTSVEFYKPHEGSVHIVVSDISGRIIVAQEVNMRQGNISLDISGLSKGTYLLKIQGMDIEHTALLISTGTARQSPALQISGSQRSKAPHSIYKEYLANNPLKSASSTEEIVEMQYDDGDQLLLTGYLVTNRADVPLVPISSQEVSFNFSPLVDFHASEYITSTGSSIQFTDTSINNPTSWGWDFGDGNGSWEQHPVHTYGASGTYTIELTAVNEYGHGRETKTDYITVNPLVPISEFIADPVVQIAGETVQFTDLSLNEPSAWDWNFGDGGSSTEANPTHAFAAKGSYTVSLTVSNSTGSDSETKTDYIRVTPPVPVADFSATPVNPSTGETIQFTDLSLNEISTWEWDFGDGQSSTLTNPSHTYSSSGMYAVSLTVTNVSGSDTETKTNYITVSPLVPVADFSASPVDPSSGESIQFTDLSINEAASWNWDFGDGQSSTASDPSHAYTSSGVYTVSLTVSNATGSDTETKTNYITVSPLVPVAEFSASPIDPSSGESVQFTDLSINEPASWDWDFGDGQSSTASDPSHAYSLSGSYTVRLTVSNATGTDSETKTNYITVSPLAPVAEFSASPVDPVEGESVQFTDLSINEPASWDWDFGDGQSSTASNPSHAYSSTGTYTVRLTVSNATGTDSETKTNFITVYPPVPVADFTASPLDLLEGESVQFTDQSSNSPTTWDWDFGDGQSSTASDPSHTYSTAGTYSVSLTVTNAAGTDTETKNNLITVNPEVSGTISDIDGNTYNTVVIGSQVWMAENLRTTRYADGTAIPYVENATSWASLGPSDPAYCWWANNSANGAAYGAMYNWPAAMNGAGSTDANPSGVQGVCPSGWHMPSDSEWIELEMQLGMSYANAIDFDFRGTDEGGQLKETGTVHWNSPNTGATNVSGFTARAGGFRRPTAEFYGMGIFADIWTTTDNAGDDALRRYLPYNSAQVFRNYLSKNFGFSVRCIQD